MFSEPPHPAPGGSRDSGSSKSRLWSDQGTQRLDCIPSGPPESTAQALQPGRQLVPGPALPHMGQFTFPHQGSNNHCIRREFELNKSL